MPAALSRFVVRWWSVSLAVVIALGALSEVIWADRGGVGAAVILAGCVAVGCSRWFPYAVFAAIAVLALGVVIAPESVYVGDSGGLLLVVMAAVLGSLCDRRDRVIGLFAFLAALTVLILRVPEEVIKRDGGVSTTQQLVSNLILTTLVWLASWLIAARVRATRELRARAARLEAERDALAREAVAEERARIARELHDVVAHSVSVMTVQAGGVRRLLTADQARERAALTAIEETGRRALTEMRRMVSVMRSGGQSAGLEPQPGVATLTNLVNEVREAGLPVTLDLAPTAGSLPAGLDLSVYRIVQEGLTNVMKHAGPAHAWVSVEVQGAGVDVVIEDDGAGTSGANGEGHGLIGMRERVAVYGGKLETGPRAGGGFRIHARLPIDTAVGEAAS